jgi:undecaprenyl-diphosphatase
MNLFHAVILGVVEGITEFLPISSTGHLILASEILRIPDSEFLKTFEIAIQLGAILSVVVLYWRKIISSVPLLKKLAVAFLPTAVVGLIAYPYVKGYLLGSEQVVLWSLFLGGVAIFLFEKYHPHQKANTDLGSMSYKQALGIGLAQAVAIVPGVSRAAATILGGMFAGMDRKSIVEFSFLLAIPTMAAATGLDLATTSAQLSSSEWTLLGVGFLVSFLTALAAIKWLLGYIQSHDFVSFGVYRVAVAVIFWVVMMA